MKDTDRLLIGTVWTRAIGEHKGSPGSGTVDDVNARGPRLKLLDGSHRRINWAELDFGWKPEDSRSEKAYGLWKLAAHIEYTDEKLAQLQAIQTPIEREITVTNGTAPIMTTPEEGVKECHGAWHRHKGKYDLIPLSSFDVAKVGTNAGNLAAVCRDCNEKTKKAPSHLPKPPKPKKTFTMSKVVETLVPIPAVQIAPVIDTPSGAVYRWRIIVIQETEHIVQGKDFLEAAAQVSELGEITKVEKL